jgi:hypothetical protein
MIQAYRATGLQDPHAEDRRRDNGGESRRYTPLRTASSRERRLADRRESGDRVSRLVPIKSQHY